MRDVRLRALAQNLAYVTLYCMPLPGIAGLTSFVLAFLNRNLVPPSAADVLGREALSP